MKREILFRRKQIDNGEWVYGFFWRYFRDSWEYCYINYVGINIEIEPETRGRYVGLTDKNGVKIFEGDILQRKVYVYEIGKLQPDRERMLRGVVIWDGTSKTFPPFWAIQAEDKHGNPCKYVFDCEFEVIGNIHDNHELLEVQNEVD